MYVSILLHQDKKQAKPAEAGKPDDKKGKPEEKGM